MDSYDRAALRSWRINVLCVDVIKIALLVAILFAVLSGCKSQPGAEPVLETAEEIIITPAKKRIPCVKLENLSKCAGYYVIEYRSRLGGCIWKARCMSRSRF